MFKRLLFLALTFCLLSVAFCDSIQGVQQAQQSQQMQAAQQAQQGQQMQAAQQGQQMQAAQQGQQMQAAQQQQNWNHGGKQLNYSQNKSSSWEDNGVTYSVFQVTVVNCGHENIRDATIVAESNFITSGKPSDVWNIEHIEGNRYHFPSYITASSNGIEVGRNFTFGYINKSNNPATFSFCDFQ